MAEYRIMDISGWNTKVPYEKLDSYGIKGGIFRITERGNGVDSMFERHWKGFSDNGFTALGVYKYSYAKNIKEIQKEAEIVVKTLNGRACPLGVWLDVEDDSQRNISRQTMVQMIAAFREVIINAGYHFGVYCGKYWYTSVLDSKNLPYDFWVAAYANDGSFKEALRPNVGEVGWQYTGSFKIDGGGYDMSVFDKAYIDNLMNGAPTVEKKETGDVNAVIEKAITWMEDLANDDSHGYDQILRWGETGDYDCSSATIIAWQTAGVPVKTAGATYTGNMYNVFIKNGFADVTNKVNLNTGEGLVRGDVLLNEVHHVAMYCGNGKEVEASINEKGGATYGEPGDQTGREILIRNYRNYPWNKILRLTSVPVDDVKLRKGCVGAKVSELQTKLNKLGYGLVVDGEFGSKTFAAVVDFQNKNGFALDGVVDDTMIAKLNEAIVAAETKPAETEVPAPIEDAPVEEPVEIPAEIVAEPAEPAEIPVTVIEESAPATTERDTNTTAIFVLKELLPFTGIVTVSALNVRKESNTSSEIIKVIKRGDYVYLTKAENNFAYADEFGGWVSLKYIAKAFPYAGVCTGDDVNIRKEPNGEIVGKLNKGDEVNVVGINDTKKWFKTTDGWVFATYVKKKEGEQNE